MILLVTRGFIVSHNALAEEVEANVMKKSGSRSLCPSSDYINVIGDYPLDGLAMWKMLRHVGES